MKKLLIVISALLLTFQASCFAAGSNAGTSTAQFLKLGAGARAAGIGETYVGIADDANAVYWNPAGLAGLTRKELSVSEAVWFEDISYQFLSGVLPTKAGTFGIGVQSLSYGNIDQLDATGLKTGSFSPTDMMAGLSYGRSFGHLSLGATLKYISSKITNTATASALDIGAQYPLVQDKLTGGIAVSNIGTKMKFINDEEPLPMNVKLGAAYYCSKSWLAALDINMPNDDTAYGSAGVEKKFSASDNVTLAGRLGYNTITKDVTGTSGMSAGFGLKVKDYSLDASFSPYGDLGSVTKITVGAKF